MAWWLSRLFGWLRPSPPPKPEPPVNPLVAAPHPDATTLRLAIYQTASLTDANGRHPEQTVARYAREALTRAGYNVHITFGYAPAPDRGYATADLDALHDWTAHPSEDSHVSLLLHHRDQNGIAFVGGRYGIAPGGEIDRLVELATNGETPAHRNVRAALHELGHTLGGRHADGMIPTPHLTYQHTDAGWMTSPPPNA